MGASPGKAVPTSSLKATDGVPKAGQCDTLNVRPKNKLRQKGYEFSSETVGAVVMQAARHEMDTLQKEAKQSHTLATQARGALAQMQVDRTRYHPDTQMLALLSQPSFVNTYSSLECCIHFGLCSCM